MCVCVCVCVCVALVIQHAKRIPVLYCHLWPICLLHNFRHCTMNGTIFGKKLLNMKCVFWFCLWLWLGTFYLLRRIQWDIIIIIHKKNYPFLLSYFDVTWIFSTGFWKILKYQILSNCPVSAELFHAGGRIDMKNLIAAFRNFANSPRNGGFNFTVTKFEQVAQWRTLCINTLISVIPVAEIKIIGRHEGQFLENFFPVVLLKKNFRQVNA